MASSWRFPRRGLAFAGGCLSLALCPSSARAQNESPAAPGFGVEGLVGLVYVPRVERMENAAVGCHPEPCPRRADRQPGHGGGVSFRVGARLRPVSYLELGLSGEADIASTARVYTVPLLVYYRLRTDRGPSFTFGLGGGVSHIRDLGESETVGIVRTELGVAVPLSARWSISSIAQVSFSVGSSYSHEEGPRVGPSDQGSEWLTFSLGPRYSF